MTSYDFYFSQKQKERSSKFASMGLKEDNILQVITSDLEVYYYTEMIKTKEKDKRFCKNNSDTILVHRSDNYAIIVNGKPASDLARHRMELSKFKRKLDNF